MLTDTLIETQVTLDLLTRTLPSSLLFQPNTKEKKKKEYCSEAVCKVRYIMYTENKKSYVIFCLFPEEKRKKKTD